VHTAGVLAGYHGRRGVLKWLIDERGVRVWGGGVCGVCIECKPPRPHNDTIDVTAAGWQARYGGVCPVGHKVPMFMSICDAVIVGGHAGTYEVVKNYPVVEAPPTNTRYYEAEEISTTKLLKFACKWAKLDIAQMLYAQLVEEGLPADWTHVRKG
jgi:hypothetical protein